MVSIMIIYKSRDSKLFHILKSNNNFNLYIVKLCNIIEMDKIAEQMCFLKKNQKL